jgi:hypothetical protein
MEEVSASELQQQRRRLEAELAAKKAELEAIDAALQQRSSQQRAGNPQEDATPSAATPSSSSTAAGQATPSTNSGANGTSM